MKFIADEMHGKLIRWLRMLGYDTISTAELSSKEKKKDPEVLLMEKCFTEHRIAISNDKELLKKIETRFYKIINDTPEVYFQYHFDSPMAYGLISPCFYPIKRTIKDLLFEMKKMFNISLEYSTENSRCAKCNSGLNRIVRKEEIKAIVPEKVFRFQKKFWICENHQCAQLYWNGTQIRSNIDTLAEINKMEDKQ